MSKAKEFVLRVIIFIISAGFSILLLESSGVDLAKANILSWEEFSLPILILLGICLDSCNEFVSSFIKRRYKDWGPTTNEKSPH